MAEILVSPIFDTVIRTLASPALQEYQLQRGFNKELKKLSRTLERIRDVLDDAEEKQVKEKAVKNWLIELKDVAYDANDILEEFAIEATLQSKAEDGLPKNQVRRNFFLPCFCFKEVGFRHNIGNRINEIRKRIDEIANERSQFDLRERVAETQPSKTEHRQQTHSFIKESEVYGREEDKAAIVELLLTDEGSQNNLSVISVVGLGGLGKTTLAQLAYNNERVEKHFELRIWVYVSNNFHVRQLTKSIIESITGKKCKLPDMDSLQRHLQQLLSGKRFLLVLDDIWNEDHGKWEDLRNLLSCGNEGSKIIVTTRIEKVARIMGSVSTYPLKSLSENDCWTLFKQRAFGVGRDVNPNLVAIGKDIVKKCGGVPLAAKALGSLMCFKTEEWEWLFVKESEIWHLPEDENGILPALKLSYNHLLPHLRQCFAYCAIFPKDYQIEREQLIELWMANNFIPSKARMELEDHGNEIFNELLWRSFFQDTQKDDDGSIITFKMHDLVHDLARYIMGDECFNINISNMEKVPKRIRHLSLSRQNEFPSIINEVLCGQQALHTFYLSSNRPHMLKNIKNPPYISKYKCLRVLDLSYCFNKDLPISTENLKHLRYLDLSHTYIEALPESISTLLNLQTLKLKCCDELCKLPSGMRNMIGLRHLDIRGCGSLTNMPTRIGQLSCLKMLTTFIVGENEGCGIEELQNLNLRGILEVLCLEKVRNGRAAKQANLIGKPNLKLLKLSWSNSDGNANSCEVLEGLKPHCNIRRMEINNYGGTEFPYWLRDSSLSNLVYISLTNSKRCQHLPIIGQLPFLEVLYISGFDAVRCAGNEFYGGDISVKGFPSLKEFNLNDMSNLEEWSTVEGREVFPLLKKLQIYKCPKLTKMPPRFLSLEELTLEESNAMLLRFVANLTSLSSLDIRGFLVSLPEEMLRNLTQLQSLEIRRFPNLRSLSKELDNLTALKNLSISSCEELESLPGKEAMRGLSSLQTLTIEFCNKLTSVSGGLQHLTALESLYIYKCRELVSLTKEGSMGQLTALRSLFISACPKLESLPEGTHRLTALQYLMIKDCPELESLPNEGMSNLTSLRELYFYGCDKLTSLPDGLQLLTALQQLGIGRCPNLEKRCKKETGEDWHKIAHVPHIQINDQ